MTQPSFTSISKAAFGLSDGYYPGICERDCMSGLVGAGWFSSSLSSSVDSEVSEETIILRATSFVW